MQVELMRLQTLHAAFAALSLSSVAPASAQAPITVPPPSAQAPRSDADYVLGASDKIRVIVYNETELSGEFIITPSGAVSVPLIGDVSALGKTVSALQAAIEARLREGYLKDPHVSIEVLTFRPFYILGEVNKPGEYPFTPDLTVTKAVATASGFTYRANTHRVFIRHVSDNSEHSYSMKDVPAVRPGDIIRVGERIF